MKTATARDLRNKFASIATWLEQGETVLLTRRGQTLGRIVPEPKVIKGADKARKQLFAQRFASLDEVPKRNLASIVQENRDR